jgi:hypothetical protein
LDEAASQRVTLDAVRSGEYAKWAPYSERLKLARMDFKARLYNLLRHPTKPKLFGSNLGIWREDYERVNGYDEKFEGWGCEDDDLRLRLRQAGVRIRSISRWTCTHHLWHPVDVTFPKTGRWRDNANVKHIRRKRRLTRCLNGMTKRAAGDLKIRVVGRPARPELAEKLLGATLAQAAHGEDSDFEVLFLPGDGSYTGRADCKVLVVLEETPAAAKAARKADVVVAERRYPGVDEGCSFRLDQFDQALQAVA